MADNGSNGAAGTNLQEMGKAAKEAARILYRSDTATKNLAILAMAVKLRSESAEILAANAEDVREAEAAGISGALLDRLQLDADRLESIARDVENVARLQDQVGLEFDQRDLPGGMHIRRRRVPLGVIGVIYEARPNVTVDVATLCLKSGNAVILRGGKETLRTNTILARLLQQVLADHGLPKAAIQLIESRDRDLTLQLLKLDQFVDMIIPRGGAALHEFCREQSTIPVITGGIGVCHLFADSFLDIDLAVPVIVNAKVQRPTVCNALDTLLVHHSIAQDLLPDLAVALGPTGVEIRADVQAYPYFEKAGYPKLSHSTHHDFGTEFLDLILSVRIVEDLDEALGHITQYSSGHSDGILTLKSEHADRFLNEVDSAAVYVNASTRFTDGAMFGLGA
ncbi:MAG: glutamate-5-semialdehyde dehydrogenase, partial [Candidatus Sericytochromatia bacterium]